MRSHGTISCYKDGCHCPDCTQASTAYKASYRARQRATRDNGDRETHFCVGCLTELRSRGVARHERACLA